MKLSGNFETPTYQPLAKGAISKEPAYHRISALERMSYLNNSEHCRGKVYSPLEILDFKINDNLILYKNEAVYSKVKSFKNRGAWNALTLYYSSHKNRRLSVVIAPSAGNHAQGVLDSVASFRDKGYSLHVSPAVHLYITKTTAPSKVAALREKAASSGLSVEIFDSAKTFDEAEDQAIKAAQSISNSLLIHPFNDPNVIEGQGTLAEEIVEQLNNEDLPLNKVRMFIPVGGGGLAAGFVRLRESLPTNQQFKIVGVQLEGADAAYQTWQQGKVISIESENLNYLADGTMVGTPGKHTAPYIVKLDDFVTVSNAQVGEQYHRVTNETGWSPSQIIAEPASMIGQTGCYTYDRKCTGRGIEVPTDEVWVTLNTGIHANLTYVDEYIKQYLDSINE